MVLLLDPSLQLTLHMVFHHVLDPLPDFLTPLPIFSFASGTLRMYGFTHLRSDDSDFLFQLSRTLPSLALLARAALNESPFDVTWHWDSPPWFRMFHHLLGSLPA